jgi:hypothetical protein
MYIPVRAVPDLLKSDVVGDGVVTLNGNEKDRKIETPSKARHNTHNN